MQICFTLFLIDRDEMIKIYNTESPMNFTAAPGARGGIWVFFGWVCAARDSKLASRSKKKFPLKLIPRSRIRPKTDTPF